ncbi:phosphoethanolamine transferase [Neptuniibacter halophilus]|uniref:phosphoethanolamine transferase n=1 Tax=Neptuniibacter halophilus TaxID=651666 RepID=UPI002573BB5E|nr:phosphoethanolamine transferase [Neptuniibacter halophilus]
MNNIFALWVERGKASPKLFFLLIFMALAICDLLLVRDLSWLLNHLEGKRFWVNYSFSLASLFLLMICMAPIRSGVIRSLFLFFILGTQIAQQSYFAVYGSFVSVFDLRFVAADPLLTLELWLGNAIILKPLLLLLIELPLLMLLFRLELRPHWLLKGSSLVLASLLFLLVTFSWYGISKFQFSSVAYAGIFPGLIERHAFETKLAEKPAVPEQTPAADAPNIVYVIGESLTLDHLGIYGYERQTTPRLQQMMDRNEVLLYRNAVSIGTRTLSSVPYMLTGLQGIDPAGLVYSSPTLFNYAKAAGYRTALITAQDFQWRNVDQIFVDPDMDFYQSGTDFSASVSVSDGADDIKVLEEGILPFLDQHFTRQDNAPLMLVTQMNGSHYPYTTHSPASIKQFLPELDENDINAYDNTVLYTDLYLQRLVEGVRAHDPEAWVFFSSDHGQDISKNKTQFNRGYSSGVIHNALMVFPPKSALNALPDNINSPVSQADIFATILDLMQIEPISEINGVSLRQPIDPERLRVVSAYMKTLHNEPNAVLVFPDLGYIHVDFDRQSATLQDGQSIIPYAELDQRYRDYFERRLTPTTEAQ